MGWFRIYYEWLKPRCSHHRKYYDIKFKENDPFPGTQPGFLGVTGSKLHGDVGFWLLQCINMLIMNIKWPENTHLKKIYRHIKIKLMAPSTLAECVKLEVSTWCLQAARETETLKSMICDSEPGGKGALWGECRLRRWAPPGSISCQLQCWRQLHEWWKAAALGIMCEVTPSGDVSSASLKFWGRLPSWHGWWSCWTEPGLALGCASGQRRPWRAWALRRGHSWQWLRLISLFCALLFRVETLLLFVLLLYLPLPLHNKKSLL